MPLAEARQEGYIHQRFVRYLRKGGEQGKKPKMGCGVVCHMGDIWQLLSTQYQQQARQERT